MLAGLEGTGLVGLGVLPGPLRRVAMAEGGFRAPDDLRGKLVGIQEFEIAAMTFEELGATTKTLPSGAILDGEDAVEQQLGSVVGNRYHKDLPHVTVDLALWPRPVILFANKARFDTLSGEQQTALRGVAKQLVASTTAAVESEDASAVAILCADGADLVVAGEDAKAALLTAVRPVYDELEKDAKTASMFAAHRGDEGRDPDLDIDHRVPKPIGLHPAPQTAGGFPEGTYEARTLVRRAQGLLGSPSGAAGRGPVPLSDGDGLHPEGQRVRRELRRALEVQLLRRPYPARKLHVALVMGWQAADLQRDRGGRRGRRTGVDDQAVRQARGSDDTRRRVPGRDLPGADLRRGDERRTGRATTCRSTSACPVPASASSRSATASGQATTGASGSRASSATS